MTASLPGAKPGENCYSRGVPKYRTAVQAVCARIPENKSLEYFAFSAQPANRPTTLPITSQEPLDGGQITCGSISSSIPSFSRTSRAINLASDSTALAPPPLLMSTKACLS